MALLRPNRATCTWSEAGVDDVGLQTGDFSSDTLKRVDFRCFIILLSSFMLRAYYRAGICICVQAQIERRTGKN